MSFCNGRDDAVGIYEMTFADGLQDNVAKLVDSTYGLIT